MTVFWVVLSLPATAVDRLKIDESGDAELMPFEGRIVQRFAISELDKAIYRPNHVLWRDSINHTAAFVISINFISGLDQPSALNSRYFPSWELFDDDPVPMLIRDLAVAYDGDSTRALVIGAGLRHDTVFFFTSDPRGDTYKEIFLGTGEDRTGDGSWNGRPIILPVADIDADSIPEALVYSWAGRDSPPRELIALDIDSCRVKWRLPVAGGVPGTKYVTLTGHQSAPIMIVTACPGQGFRDEEFDDTFSYLATVTPKGRIEAKHIVGRFPVGSTLKTHPDSNHVFLFHTLPFGISADSGLIVETSPRLSLIAESGNLVKTVPVAEETGSFWLQDYDRDGRPDLHTLSLTGVIRIYNDSLELLAESERSILQGVHGIGMPLDGHPFTLWFNERSGTTGIYSPDFEKLAQFTNHTCFDTLLIDRTRETGQFLASDLQNSMLNIVEIRRRHWTEFIRIIYNRYQNYFMAALFALLVGLVVVNFYRVRTRKNLRTIAEQKAELETAHQQLRDAQQRLIEAEKYKQAQEIAGGFAHEIRNALLPAEIAHRKVRRLLSDNPDAIKHAERAVNRALQLVNLVSTYTSITERKSHEPVQLRPLVEEVVADLAGRIEDSGVTVTIDIDPSIKVTIDPQHLHITLSNLLSNALDAIGSDDRGSIGVSATQGDRTTVIEVADNGPGIPETILARMFEPFVSSRPHEGHGLGLALVKRIVTVYGGEITAKNRAEGGAVMTVTFGSTDSTVDRNPS